MGDGVARAERACMCMRACGMCVCDINEIVHIARVRLRNAGGSARLVLNNIHQCVMEHTEA